MPKRKGNWGKSKKSKYEGSSKRSKSTGRSHSRSRAPSRSFPKLKRVFKKIFKRHSRKRFASRVAKMSELRYIQGYQEQQLSSNSKNMLFSMHQLVTGLKFKNSSAAGSDADGVYMVGRHIYLQKLVWKLQVSSCNPTGGGTNLLHRFRVIKFSPRYSTIREVKTLTYYASTGNPILQCVTAGVDVTSANVSPLVFGLPAKCMELISPVWLQQNRLLSDRTYDIIPQQIGGVATESQFQQNPNAKAEKEFKWKLRVNRQVKMTDVPEQLFMCPDLPDRVYYYVIYDDVYHGAALNSVGVMFFGVSQVITFRDI